MKINIPLRGMTNVPDDNYSKDGDMYFLLNMRHKGGELVPCQPPRYENPNYSVKKAMYHSQSGKSLELLGDGSIIISGGEAISPNRYNDFAIMGNIVVMYNDNAEYAIWRNGGYHFLGALPDAPRLKATGLETLSITKTTTEVYWYGKYVPAAHDLYFKTVQKGFIDELLDTVYDKKGYVDRAWFKVGLRLFDGSYISTSGIYQLSSIKTGQDDTIGRWIPNMWRPLDSSAESSMFKAYVEYFKPTLSVDRISDEWRDIIVAIDVFSTGSIMSITPKKSTDGTVDSDGDELKLTTKQYEMYVMRSPEELRDAMVDAEFYKVAEFSIDGTLLWEVDKTSPSIMAQQKSLGDVSTHTVIPEKSTVYNARLHAGGVKNIFFKGYNPAYSIHNETEGRGGKYTVVTYIDTWEGEKRVIYNENTRALLPELLYYFSYPDSRAKRMELYYENDEGGGYYKLSLPLIAHKTRDEAYFVKVGSTIPTQPALGYPIIETDFDWVTANSIPTEDNIQEEKDVLKVSAVDNPFYFPTAQTYKFEGNIEGVASNAEAISTGQFGSYPLFVFTDKGIWAMSVDTSGQGAYTSQSPFSREVCSGEICPVSGGVVFSTRRGLMAISGGDIMELSAPVDGEILDIMVENEGLFEQIFFKGTFENYFVPASIREYLDGAKLAYNYLHNEILICNKSDRYGYSYVYNLGTQSWSTIDTLFDVVANNYPELVAYNNVSNEKCFRYTFDDGNESVPIVAITRPIKAETLDFKRLRQAALRCTFDGSLNFYILGSNDGAKFVCITGKEWQNGTHRDLITSMSRSKQYKYIVVAIAGKMRGRVSLVEMLVEGGFASNQLR